MPCTRESLVLPCLCRQHVQYSLRKYPDTNTHPNMSVFSNPLIGHTSCSRGHKSTYPSHWPHRKLEVNQTLNVQTSKYRICNAEVTMNAYLFSAKFPSCQCTDNQTILSNVSQSNGVDYTNLFLPFCSVKGYIIIFTSRLTTASHDKTQVSLLGNATKAAGSPIPSKCIKLVKKVNSFSN